MLAHSIFYIYPLSKWVSFRIIAENHVRELRRYFNVQVFDEKTVMVVMPVARLSSKTVFFIQPFFYPMQVYERRLIARIGKPERLIGVDVADSDHITQEAVRLTGYATAMIVPSSFSRNAYVNSGVRVPVYVVPHGVPDIFLDPSPSKPRSFGTLLDYKSRTGRRLIQIWLLHSSYRKGEDIAYETFNRLIAERDDVALVVRRPMSIEVYDTEVRQESLKPSFTLTASWLTDSEIRELMDVCDVYLLASRGGGFEHPPLLALSRLEPVVAARGGAWEDYLPAWSLVPSHRSEQVLSNNPIHDGYGVEMEVEPAVTKLHEILDNLDDYRARVEDHVSTCVKEKFIWSKIGLQLKDIVTKHLC
jgi:glycosyltransferase involved in cell wall biosynthesis